MKISMTATHEDWLLSDRPTRSNLLHIFKHVTCFLVNFRESSVRKDTELTQEGGSSAQMPKELRQFFSLQ